MGGLVRAGRSQQTVYMTVRKERKKDEERRRRKKKRMYFWDWGHGSSAP